MWYGPSFSFGDYTIALGMDSGELFEILENMGDWGKDIVHAMNEGRDSVPGTIEEAGVLIGAIEILRRRRPDVSPELRRLHYALRDYHTPDEPTR